MVEDRKKKSRTENFDDGETLQIVLEVVPISTCGQSIGASMLQTEHPSLHRMWSMTERFAQVCSEKR